MKVSLNWLNDYVKLDASVDEICRAITFLGFEVEQVIRTGAPKLSNVVVGEVLTREKHPNADKLSVCTVDLGSAGGVKTIVCGAQNYKVGDRVPVALPGAVLPGNFEIKQAKVRGQLSDGMMCSAKELAISEDAAGLLILDGRPELGKPINDVLPSGDVVFDIEITPNRPDCLGHLGIARELAAWFKKDLTYPVLRFDPTSAGPARSDLLKQVRVTAAEDCPLYTATVISGVKVGPSPSWLQERLRAIGLRPINNIVDIGNYVMLEYNQPMHAFDARKLGGAEILVRRASPGERIVTLDGKERALTEQMLVIADATRPAVVAGIMGGENSGVDDSTTDLVLEVAYFKRQSVRATSKRLGLSSDSSYRYERGVDAHSLDEALRRAIDLIVELAGGRVAGATWRVGADVPWEREIEITPRFVWQKLGFEIPVAEMLASLDALELTVSRVEENVATPADERWTVSIPSWRDDLDRPIDLVEEILRIYGTERIPVSPVLSPALVGGDDPIVRFNRAVTAQLVGQGFNECVNYTLQSSRDTQGWSVVPAETLALANPFVDDQSHLRPTLLAGLLESLKLNQARGVAATRLFETGRVFVLRKGSLHEALAVGFVVADDRVPSWLKREAVDFYTVKRDIEALVSAAGIDFARQPVQGVTEASPGWQAGHAATAGDIEHGWSAAFGLLDLARVKAQGVEGKVYAGMFTILPEKLGAADERRRYQPFGLFPPALRDVALVVDEATPAAEVQKAVTKAARAATGNAFAIESVAVFDVYRGKGLPEGKKSLAFSLVFRSAERTLTDDEVNAAFQQIQKAVVADGKYLVRS